MVRISGLFHPNSSPIYKWVITHLLTIDPNFQRDIQVRDDKGGGHISHELDRRHLVTRRERWLDQTRKGDKKMEGDRGEKTLLGTNMDTQNDGPWKR